MLAWALLPGACAWPTAFVDCRRGSMSWLPPNCGWRSDHSRGTGCTKWLRTFSPTPALAYCGMRRTQPNEASRQGMDQYSLGRSVRQLLESTRSRARRRPVGRRRTAGSVGFRPCSNVITDADKRLLLSLVEAAERCGTTRTGRGNAGLMSNTASAQVALQAGYHRSRCAPRPPHHRRPGSRPRGSPGCRLMPDRHRNCPFG